MTEKISLRRSAALVLGLVAIIVTVLCAHLLAQAISGDIVGTVTDATQAAVRGATVTAENEQTGVKTTTTTHASGEYRVSHLPVGSYTISATAPGFGTTKLRDGSVKLNQTNYHQHNAGGGRGIHHRRCNRLWSRYRYDYSPESIHFHNDQIMDLPMTSTGQPAGEFRSTQSFAQDHRPGDILSIVVRAFHRETVVSRALSADGRSDSSAHAAAASDARTQHTATYIHESPEYATVQSGLDSNLNGDSAGDRAIVNPTGDPHKGTDVTALTNTAGQVVAYLANDSNARYIRSGLGSFGNAGRKTLPTNPINNWDMSLVKKPSIRAVDSQFGVQASTFSITRSLYPAR